MWRVSNNLYAWRKSLLMNKFIHIDHFPSHSGRTWPSWPEVCCPQLQTSSVILNQTRGAEHPRWWWWMWHPDHSHEVENCVGHLLLGGPIPHHWSDSVQRPRAAAWEWPKAGDIGRKTGLLDHARLCEFLWAGGFGQGRWTYWHHAIFPHKPCDSYESMRILMLMHKCALEHWALRTVISYGHKQLLWVLPEPEDISQVHWETKEHNCSYIFTLWPIDAAL